MVKKSDLSASKAAAKAAKKAKQEQKANKTADKLANKAKQKAAAAAPPPSKQTKAAKTAAKAVKQEEDDLDALLASFRDRWAEEHAVHEERIATAPSRRANATLTACPGGDDLWLFGGEYFDGDRATFFADLFRYTPGANASEAGIWRSYSSPNQPGPRSAHAMAPFPASGGQLFLFGGEFASAKQTSFHHYRDLWIFHITTKAWERIDTKVRPSARSGHRMCCWKQFIVLFGGFQDTGHRTTYLGDLWIFDTTEYKWHEVKQNEVKKPAARSGFSLLPTPEGIVLHGGYCKRYVKGQRTQGVALDDTWLLTLQAGPDGDMLKSGKIEWTRRRKIGYAPGQRSGCTMALWSAKNMGALFGGVTDTEADEESMESTCHADLFGYQLAGTGRWISLNLKRAKKKGGRRRKKTVAQLIAQRRAQQGSDEEGDSDGVYGSDDEGPHFANTAVSIPTPPATVQEDEDDPDDPQKSIPLGRYNTMLAIQRNTLYCYGGIHETPNREYTLDDFYTLDLTKMERFHCLKACPVDTLEWNESDDDDSTVRGSGSESDSDEEDVAEGEDEQEGVEYTGGDSDEELEAALLDAPTESLEALKLAKAEREELRRQATAFIGVSKDAARTEADVLSTPLPGETLKVFYERSKSYWAAKAHDASAGEARGKEMRTEGFALAQNAYAEYEPILKEIERIQAEAGLDAEELKAAKAGGIAGGGAGADSRNRR